MPNNVKTINGTVGELTADGFDAAVAAANRVLVEFYADRCGFCKTMIPVLDRFAAEHPEIPVYRVNTDRETGLASRLDVYHLPTILLYRDGRETDRVSGAMRYSALETFAVGEN